MVNNTGLAVLTAVSFHDIQNLQDALAIGKDPEHLLKKKHIIGKVTYFFIHIKALTCAHDLNTTVALELEPITDGDRETLKIAIIPYHTDFVNDKERMPLKFIITNVCNRDIVTAWYGVSAIDSPTFNQMLQSHLG